MLFPFVLGIAYAYCYVMSRDNYLNLSQLMEEIDKEAKNYLETVALRVKRSGVEHVTTSLLHGDVAGSIIDLSRKLPNSLVVMTTHGFSGFKRTILGSITDKVVAQSERPVLVVNARSK